MTKAEVQHHLERRGSPAAGVLYAVAFLSGAAALTYELAWAKMLSLTFGSTTLSAAAVIAGFMGGMGLGARWYHLLGDRVRRPLAAYALLEFGIAATTAALTPLFYRLPGVFAEAASALPPGPLLRVVQFVAVFVLVLIPCLLMGATFPALCTAMIQSAPTVDRRLGWIYGINTIGGAAGVLIGGLVLIDRLGLMRTVFAANGLNVAAALAALALLRTRPADRIRQPDPGSSAGVAAGVAWALEATADATPRRPDPARELTAQTQTAIPTQLPRSLTGAVLLVSGFTTLAYEILWFRALRFLVGNSTHALGTVLVVFLVGLGAGSLLLRLATRRSPERSLALCQVGIAVLALWAMVCEALILAQPEVQKYVSIFLPEVRLQPWSQRLLIVAAVSIVTMLPATILMGLSFPLATRLFLGDVRKLGARVGTAYLLANVGSILGAILAAAAIGPALGATTGTKVCAGVNVVMGLIVFLRLGGARAATFAGLVVSVVAMAAILPKSIGLSGEGAPGRLVFEKDADLGTVQVFADPGDPTQMVMLVDGTKIGCAYGYRQTPMYLKQTVLAHLPMVLDSRIRRTLNVGLGSGSTLHTLARYQELESLDCVEINPAVVEGSLLFPEAEVYQDRRVRVIVDDAVNFLLRSDETYDLIVSDGKQDPFFSGNAALLSKEYYEFARGAMRPGGLFVQWISMTTLAGDFRVILRTLMEVFPEVEVFVFAPDNIFMVGSDEPVFGRPGLSDAEAAKVKAYADLSRFGVNGRLALLARWVGGRSRYETGLADAPLSTWDHLVLDYSPFKADPQEWLASSLENLRLLAAASNDSALPSPELSPDQNRFVRSQELVRLSYIESLAGNASEAYRLAQIATQSNPADADARMTEAMFLQALLRESRK